MKLNVTIQLQLVNLEVPDHLDPQLYTNNRWRTRWGRFNATAGPQQQGLPHPYDVEPELFVRAAKAEIAALLDQHGVDALAASIEIVPEVADGR